MVTREDLKGKTIAEIKDTLQHELDVFKITVDEITEEQELLDLEKELMKEHDETQKALKETVYELKDSVMFDGKEFKKSRIADNIAYFLNKHEVEWSYTLGMYQLVQLWRSANLTQISYEAYDSTLRLLNQTKFKGYGEWEDILAVNEYLSSCHEAYVKDTSYLIFIAQKHNTILDRLKLVSPDVVPSEDDIEMPQE